MYSGNDVGESDSGMGKFVLCVFIELFMLISLRQARCWGVLVVNDDVGQCWRGRK